MVTPFCSSNYTKKKKKNQYKYSQKVIDNRSRIVYSLIVHKTWTIGGDNLELDVMAMAEKLIALRGKRTQEEVANALDISKSALAMYEAGRRVPRDPTKARIARYYKKSVPYIFFNEKEHET